MESSIGFNRKIKYQILEEGSKNKSRPILFDGRELTISKSTGETLSDLTLKSGRETLYLSLKMSKSYYTVSSSVLNYFMAGGIKIKINEYFGFNGQKMGGFGKKFACVTKKPNYIQVKKNLEHILAQAVGTKVILIHKKTDNDVVAKKVGKSNSVLITGLSNDSYVYPEKGVRKYANIKVNAKINSKDYIVNFQFRGTTATDVGPKYMRILLERV